MKIKPGVNIQGISIKLRPALILADKIWERAGQELVITAGMDGEHSAGSLHYYGLAVDMRTRYFTDNARASVATELRASLSSDFDVIEHASHIHVEWDPKIVV